LRLRRNAGLRALADAARLDAAPSCYALGFILGPRINAGGRIGASQLGARLLATDDDMEARELASRLEALNAERKAIEARLLEEAFGLAEQELDAGRPFLWLSGEGWHKGLLGLVAGRVAERFSLPTFVTSWEAGGEGVGSARSIASVDLGRVIRAAVGTRMLMKGGGHAMAGGFRIERRQADQVRGFLAEQLLAPVASANSSRTLQLDGALSASGATLALMELLDRAAPYGPGYPEPRFAFPAHRATRIRRVNDTHVRCTLIAPDGKRIEACAFRAGDTPLAKLLLRSDGLQVHVAGKLRRDTWNGRNGVELVIDDAAEAARSR
jgi:single-stranded-DNA-specific exonuclease